MTNNEAEYDVIIYGMELAIKLGAQFESEYGLKINHWVTIWDIRSKGLLDEVVL